MRLRPSQNWDFESKYLKRGQRGLDIEGARKGGTMIVIWILILIIVDLEPYAVSEL